MIDQNMINSIIIQAGPYHWWERTAAIDAGARLIDAGARLIDAAARLIDAGLRIGIMI